MSESTIKTPAVRRVLLGGREPAAWVGLIEALLALLVAFAIGVTAESAVLIMAVVSALAGLYTRRGRPETPRWVRSSVWPRPRSLSWRTTGWTSPRSSRPR